MDRKAKTDGAGHVKGIQTHSYISVIRLESCGPKGNIIVIITKVENVFFLQ